MITSTSLMFNFQKNDSTKTCQKNIKYIVLTVSTEWLFSMVTVSVVEEHNKTTVHL